MHSRIPVQVLSKRGKYIPELQALLGTWSAPKDGAARMVFHREFGSWESGALRMGVNATDQGQSRG